MWGELIEKKPILFNLVWGRSLIIGSWKYIGILLILFIRVRLIPICFEVANLGATCMSKGEDITLWHFKTWKRKQKWIFLNAFEKYSQNLKIRKFNV